MHIRIRMTMLALMLGVSVPIAHAQDAISIENLGLYGGEIRDIAIDTQSEYVYISAYAPNGFFVSSNDGQTWAQIGAEGEYGEPQGVEVGHDGTVYILSRLGLSISTDHGDTITTVGETADYAETFVVRDNTILIGRTDGQVQLSLDGGETWSLSPLGSSMSTVNNVSIGVDGVMYATVFDMNTSSSTLYTSIDNGEAWSSVDVGDVDLDMVAASSVHAGLVVISERSTSGHLYISTDSGATWAQAPVTTYVSSITFDSTGRIYAGIYYSDDQGVTWSTVTDATPMSRVSGLIAPDPDDSTHLFGASFGAIAISTDGGQTWADTNEGITAVTVKDIAQSTDKQIVWTATNAGLAKTENFLSGAPTWVFPIHYEYYPESVWVNPTDSQHVVVGGYTAVYVTRDGGESWTQAEGWNADYAVLDIVASADASVLYAAGAYQNFTEYKTGDVLMSVDGGDTWSSMIFEDGAVQTLALNAQGSLFAGAGNIDINANGPTGIYQYVEGVWSRLSGSPEMEITAIAVDPESDSRMYATAADFSTYGADDDSVSGFYVSEDAGTTWTRITEGLEQAAKFRTMTVQYSDESDTRVYLGGMDKLSNKAVAYKSIDAGLTFGTYYTGLRNENIYAFLFDGLLTGNSTGAYGTETRVSLGIRKTVVQVNGLDKMRIRATLKDRVVQQPLSGYRVALYRKKDGVWTFVRAKRTNDEGRAFFKVRPLKKARFKVVFEPSAISAEEYASMSKTVKVRSFQ